MAKDIVQIQIYVKPDNRPAYKKCAAEAKAAARASFREVMEQHGAVFGRVAKEDTKKPKPKKK